MDSVRIFDTTLRDGEQSPGFSMNTEEKIRMARQLAALGVDVIEAGFPISSRGDLEAVQQVAREVRSVPIAALARAEEDDVNAAIEALEPAAAPRLHIFLATSDLHLRVKLNMTREQALEAIGSMIRLGRNSVGEVEFSAEDAGRTDIGFLVPGLPGGGGCGRDRVEFAGHGGLCGAGRVWRDVRAGARASGRSAGNYAERALPRRFGAGGGELAGGGARGRAADRVHD